jgi:hypothetical protein
MARNRQRPEVVVSSDTFFRALAGQLGKVPDYTFADWDPDAQKMWNAITGVMLMGGCVFMRPGTGSQSFGIAVWEGNERHPAKWLYTEDDVNEWAIAAIALAEAAKAAKNNGQH